MMTFDPVKQEILRAEHRLRWFDTDARKLYADLSQVTYIFKISVPSGEIDIYDKRRIRNDVDFLLKRKRFPADAIDCSVILLKLYIVVTIVYISN